MRSSSVFKCFAISVLSLGLFTHQHAAAQTPLNATKTNLVNENTKFASAVECGECHIRQYNEWSGSMMRYSSISPPIHTLERAENEFDPEPFHPFGFPVQGGLTASEFGQPTFLNPPEGRFAKGPMSAMPDGSRVENNLFCQKCHAPVAVLSDIFPEWSQYGGLEIDSHEVLRILSKDPDFFDTRPTQSQVNARLADDTIVNATGDDATRQRNARIATEGVTCTVCHRMNGRNTDNTFADRRPNFEPGVANSAYLFEGFANINAPSDSKEQFPIFGPYNASNSNSNNGFLDLVFDFAHDTNTTELNADPFSAAGPSNILVGNDGVKRPFISTGEMCGTCHDVRIPFPDVLVTDLSGKSEAFRRVENLFTEWRNSPWNNNNNAPDPNGTVVTDSTVLDNSIANPRGPARDVVSQAAIDDPDNLLAGALVGKVDAQGNSIKQVTTCQDCHMSKFMTDRQALPGQYPEGTIALGGTSRKVADHRFIGVDRILVDQSEFGQPYSMENTDPNEELKETNDFRRVGLADISDLTNGVDPNGFIHGGTELNGISDMREILLQKAVDFKITSGTVEGPVGNRTLPLRISVENIGAGHNIPAGLSQERQVWIELKVLEPRRDSNGNIIVMGGETQYQNVYTSGYLVEKPGDFNPIGTDLYDKRDNGEAFTQNEENCANPAFEYNCNLDDIYVILDGRQNIVDGHRLEKRDITQVDDDGTPEHDEPGDYNMRQADPEIGLQEPINLGLVNYQNGFTLGMDSAIEGQGTPILENGNAEQRRDKVFSQFISDTIDNGNALKPFEKRIEKYDVPVADRQGPFLVKARLRFRPLPPEFLTNLAKNPNSRVTPEVIARNKVIEMADDSCFAGDPDHFAPGRRCSPIATVDAGGYHTCASVDGDTAQCWGHGGAGKVGDNNTAGHDVTLAQNVLAATADKLSGVQTIASGSQHSCALLLDGNVKCWGEGSLGQLGDANAQDSGLPVDVIISDVQQVAVGGDHSCALTDDQFVLCWGSNSNGQIGQALQVSNVTYPYTVSGLTNERGEPDTIAISAGERHNCALSAMGTVRCWGSGAWGKLGDGDASAHDVITPTLVQGLQYQATQIAAGYSHTCALMADGNVKCWGGGASGKLGNGSTANIDITQAQGDVLGISGNAKQITVGRNHSCALVDNGNQSQSVKCWGVGYALGDGDANRISKASATNVDWADDVLAVDAGYYHTCMVIREGSTLCWGFNGNGQLGNGTASSSFVMSPTPITIVPTTTYHASQSNGGQSVDACTADQPWQINCTDEGDWMDLNEDTGFKWTIAGGTGGSIRLSVKAGALSGTRSMSLWVNGSEVGIVTVESSWAPRGTGAEVHLPAFLQPGDNVIELKDTEGTMELDLFYLRVSRH